MLLGLDVGSTNCKAVLYEPGRGEVAVVRRPTVTHYDENGWATYDPEELWSTVVACIREAVEVAEAATLRLDGMATSSMAESGVTLDAHGRYAYPVIAWFDPRATAEAEWWDSVISPEAFSSITGLRSHGMYSANKLLWLKRHEPEAFARIRRYLCIGDFVIYKLTGEFATDVSLASRTMLFDIGRRAWAEELAGLAGLSTSVFAPAVECGTMVGRVSRAAASETGLPAGMPVATGGHDHICASLAAGVLKAGELLDSAGTGQSILAVCSRRAEAADLLASGVSCGCHLTPGSYYVIGGVSACGASLVWAIEELGIADPPRLERGGAPGEGGAEPVSGESGAGEGRRQRLERLVSLAAQSRPGAGGVVFLPTLRGGAPPRRDGRGRGALLGLTTSATRSDVARAVLEGLAGQVGRLRRLVERATRHAGTRVVAVGGVNEEDFILQLKADVMGVTVEKCQVAEAAAMGAAMLAGVGAGVYLDVHEASAKVQSDYAASLGAASPKFLARQALQGFYTTWLDTVFAPLDEELLRFNHAVAELSYPDIAIEAEPPQ